MSSSTLGIAIAPGIPSPARSQRERLADQLDIAVPGRNRRAKFDDSPKLMAQNVDALPLLRIEALNYPRIVGESHKGI